MNSYVNASFFEGGFDFPLNLEREILFMCNTLLAVKTYREKPFLLSEGNQICTKGLKLLVFVLNVDVIHDILNRITKQMLNDCRSM